MSALLIGGFIMTNEVLKTIRSRRSVRAYKKDAVPQELLGEICEAGT